VHTALEPVLELGAVLSDYAALKLDPNFALAYNNCAVLYGKWRWRIRRRRCGSIPATRMRPTAAAP
jgi:hypothetical protein